MKFHSQFPFAGAEFKQETTVTGLGVVFMFNITGTVTTGLCCQHLLTAVIFAAMLSIAANWPRSNR